ncbi:MAG: P1 family peptidase [Christensenellaceae bacterium]|jgi:D-aminopeptidase
MGLKRRFAIDVARLPVGAKNLITDVPGVQVGHATINKENIHTGVTAILPHTENLFLEKVPAAVHVINGFGKSAGLIQVDELGTIETPILLTNTLSVPMASHALIKYMLQENIEIGRTTGTVNPLVLECNDGAINDIRALAVEEAHIIEALQAADSTFMEGDLGAGTGMRAFGLKGGIGSSSRCITINGKSHTLGALVLSNFGLRENLLVDGNPVGVTINEYLKNQIEAKEQGSIIVILATDVPLSARQLKRVAKRAGIGIGRTGGFAGNGSGEIAIAFSTAARIPHFPQQAFFEYEVLHDDYMDLLFAATVSAVEESIISSLYHAHSQYDRSNQKCFSLKEILREMELPLF